MDLTWIIKKIFGPGEKLNRYDFAECQDYAMYAVAISYGKQNIAIEGVDEIYNKLPGMSKEYKEQILAITTKAESSEKGVYTARKVCHIAKNVCKWLSIIMFVLFIYLNDDGKLGFCYVLFSLAVLFKVAEVVIDFVYKKITRKVTVATNKITDAFNARCKNCYDDMDMCYLNSLDSTERQLVIMQRQNEKMQRQMLRQSEEHHREMMQMQRSLQIAQDELLQIERDRELRRYR